MKKNLKIVILFMFIILMFTIKSFATQVPIPYYANTYRVTILNAAEDEIDKVEVLAMVLGEGPNLPGEEYEIILGSKVNYFDREAGLKCLKYKDVSELEFVDNTCIVTINNIHEYHQKKNTSDFLGRVFLRITKKNGAIYYTSSFGYSKYVGENTSDENRFLAEEYPDKIGNFECDLHSLEDVLKVELIDEKEREAQEKINTIAERSNKFYKIMFVIQFALVIYLIFLSIRLFITTGHYRK